MVLWLVWFTYEFGEVQISLYKSMHNDWLKPYGLRSKIGGKSKGNFFWYSCCCESKDSKVVVYE